MNKVINKMLTTAGLLLALASCTPQAKYTYETFEGDPLNTKIYTLPNGLKVYMTVNTEKPRIQTYIAVRTGGKNDPADATGLAHYLEHLMFKGTSKFGTTNFEAEKPLIDSITALYEVYRNTTDTELRRAIYHQIDSISGIAAQYAIPNEYDKMMSIIGAEGTNAYTSTDVTCYTEDIPSNQIENWARIQANRFQDPVFRLFHTELEAVYEEKNISMTRDNEKTYEAIARLLLPHHPYGRQTVIGEQEHLKNPSLIYIRDYFNKWYVPNNTAICLSGDFEPDHMIDVITQYFGEWKPNNELKALTFEKEAPIETPIHEDVFGQEAEHLRLAWRLPGAATRDAEIAQFVGAILYNGTAGLIDLDLVQSQKVQMAYASCILLADYSCFSCYARPLPNQSLDELRTLILAEVDKLRKGEFDDELVTSVLTDIKLRFQQQLENNDSRANLYVESFINGSNWQDEVNFIDRLSKITKQDVIDFANKYLSADSYAYVNKYKGDDQNIKVIEKPAITPVNANRDTTSQFLCSIRDNKPAPIAPSFVDFTNDLASSSLPGGTNLLSMDNKLNDRFQLLYIYEMGSWADATLSHLPAYYALARTSSMSPDAVRKAFYRLGCDSWISCTNRRLYITLSGLNENLAQAVSLLDSVLYDIQPDNASFETYIEKTIKQRNDNKLTQRNIASALNTAAVYGTDYIKATVLSNAQLTQLKANDLTDRIHALPEMAHRVFYFGPSDNQQVAEILKHRKAYSNDKPLTPIKENVIYKVQKPEENMLYYAAYTANNAILTKRMTTNLPYDLALEPCVELYNEYFGGSMNGIVFQEMRETRGLAYNAWAFFNAPGWKDQTYSFGAQITTQNDKLADAFGHFTEIIEDLPQSDASFENAKTALINRMRTQRTVRDAVFWLYINAQDLGLDSDPNRYIYENIQNLSFNEILNFQQQHIKGGINKVCVVADPKQMPAEKLNYMGKLKKLSLEEIFGY